VERQVERQVESVSVGAVKRRLFILSGDVDDALPDVDFFQLCGKMRCGIQNAI
jgi:hypothetical protein